MTAARPLVESASHASGLDRLRTCAASALAFGALLLAGACGGGGGGGGGTPPAVPELGSIAPLAGSSLGGTSATLTGAHFAAIGAGATTVEFGAVPATAVVVVDDATITCTVPAGVAGTSVDVVVTNDLGTDSLVAGFAYHALPTLTSVVASSGSALGGTSVTLTGSGFLDDDAGANAVSFDGAAALNVVVVDDSTITCETPPGAGGTSVDVEVSNDNGSALLAGGFSYFAAPTLASVAPAAGSSLGGATIVLTGTGFQDNAAGVNGVSFGGVAAANVVVLNDTSLECELPAGTPGAAVDVELANANGSAVLVGGFTYHALPTLVSVAPASGPADGGTALTLTGTGFQANAAGVNAVLIGGQAAANIVTVNDTTITCEAPAGTAGESVDVELSNANGTASLVDGYDYHPEPTLVSVAPDSGTSLGGTSLTLTGTGFSANAAGVNTVLIDAVAATSVVVVNDTTLTCVAPAGAAGDTVDVALSNANGDALLAAGFEYHALPTLTAVVPAVGSSLGGTAVTLQGSGFQVDGAGVNTVLFDGVAATGVAVVDDDTITCTTPPGVAASAVDVSLANANGEALLANGFGYHAEPQLTGIAPNVGSVLGGTLVTLTGSGFQANGAGANAVSFGGIAATNVVVVNDTELTCETPASPAGSVDVVLSNANGSDTLVAAFTFALLPDALQSSVELDPAAGVLADGSAEVGITVTVRDALGDPIQGAEVELAASGLGNALVQPLAPTDANGVATGSLSTTVAEAKQVAATVDPSGTPVLIDEQPSASFVWPNADVFYVRASGSDLASGASPAEAWATIGFAAQQLTAGQTVYVGAGTYAESVLMTTDGAPGTPIRFLADRTGEHTGDAGAVVIDGEGSASSCFQVDGADHVEVEGFVLIGQAGNLASGGAALRIGPGVASGVVLRDNEIRACLMGIRAQDAVDPLIESNRISDIENAASGRGITVRDTSGARIRNNLVYGCESHGIELFECPDARVESNTLYANLANQVQCGGASSVIAIEHNIVVLGGDNGLRALGATVTSDYNLVFGHPGQNWSGLAQGANDLDLDPFLVDPDGADGVLGGSGAADDVFALDESVPSPAIGAGAVDAHLLVLSAGETMADRTTRSDAVLDGELADGDTLNLGYHSGAQTAALPALESRDARLHYASQSAAEDRRQTIVRSYDDSASTWSAEGLARPVGTVTSAVVALRSALSPLADGEELLFALAADGSGTELDLQRWTGASWQVDGTSTGIPLADASASCFDLAYEDSTGDALAVYSDGSATPLYRTRSQGQWSAPAALPLNDGGGGPNPDLNAQRARWIELEPRPGSAAIALGYVDLSGALVAIEWDGAQWVTASATLLEADVKDNTNTSLVENRAFDLAYEATSGDLLATWARDDSPGFFWSVKAAGGNVWSAATQETAAMPGDTPHQLDLAGEAASNRIALGLFDLGDGDERVGLAVWDGVAWVDQVLIDAQARDANDGSTGDFAGAVGWAGSSGVALCVYADDAAGALDWARWTSGAGWALQTDVPIAGKGFTESVLLAPRFGPDGALAVLSDSNDDLYVATYDGLAWTLAEAGAALEDELSTLGSVAFTIGLKR